MICIGDENLRHGANVLKCGFQASAFERWRKVGDMVLAWEGQAYGLLATEQPWPLDPGRELKSASKGCGTEKRGLAEAFSDALGRRTD